MHRHAFSLSLAFVAAAGASANGPVQAVKSWGPMSSATPAGHFREIAGGLSIAAGLRLDGSVSVWSSELWGIQPVPAKAFVDIDVYGNCVAGVDMDGDVHVWGNVPSDLSGFPPPGDFQAIAVGPYHAVLIRTNGTLAGWGYNGSGQTNVPSGTFKAVACGDNHSVGLRTDGSIVCWGSNAYGQSAAPAGTFTQIDAADEYSMALRSDGVIIVWGNNNWSQFNVPAGNFKAISAAQTYCAAVRTDGALVAWGGQSYGNLNVPAGQSYWMIAAGNSSLFAAKSSPITHVDLPTIEYPERLPAALAAAVTSDAPLEFEWRRGGALVTNGGRVTGAGTSTLLIDNVGLDDEGAYTVTARNHTGATLTKSFNLTVSPYAAPGPDSGFDPYHGHAIAFNGAGTQVMAPFASAHNSSGDFTVEAWARVDGGAGMRRTAVASQDYFTGGLTRRGYLFLARENDTWECWTGAGTEYVVFEGPAVRPGKWTHLALVRQGLGFAFYVDGQLADSIGISTFIPNNRQPLTIGCGLGTLNEPHNFFPGAVDEVRVWSGARSQQQILALMNTAPSAQDSTLMGWWRLDEGAGLEAKDSAPAGGLTHGARSVGSGWFATFGPGAPPPPASACPTDMSGDGLVNSVDLALLLGTWGACR